MEQTGKEASKTEHKGKDTKNKKIRVADFSKNRDLAITSIFGKGKYKFEKLESQIFLTVIAAAQEDINRIIAHRVSLGLHQFEIPKADTEVVVTFSLNDYPLDMKGHEYRLKAAAEGLVQKVITLPVEGGWETMSLVSKIKYLRENRTLQLTIAPEVWDKILDIRHFIQIEMYPAYNLTPNGLRFYMLVAGLDAPREFTLEDLRSDFELTKVYKENRTFYRKIIKGAKKELDESAPLTFDEHPVKRPETGEIIGVVIAPKQNSAFRDKILEGNKLKNKLSVGWALNASERFWLEEHLGIDDNVIKRNFDTFYTAKKVYGEGLTDKMASIYEAMFRNGKAPQANLGYFIRSLQNAVSDLQNIGEEDAATQGSLF